MRLDGRRLDGGEDAVKPAQLQAMRHRQRELVLAHVTATHDPVEQGQLAASAAPLDVRRFEEAER